METFDDMLEQAGEYRDDEDLIKSSGVLIKMLEVYPNHKKIFEVHTILGGDYRNLGEYEKAITHYKRSLELKPEFEDASIGLVYACGMMGLDEEADKEIIRYLSKYPIRLYHLFFTGIFREYQGNYTIKGKEEIIKLAKAKGVGQVEVVFASDSPKERKVRKRKDRKFLSPRKRK